MPDQVILRDSYPGVLQRQIEWLDGGMNGLAKGKIVRNKLPGETPDVLEIVLLRTGQEGFDLGVGVCRYLSKSSGLVICWPPDG